MNNSVTKQIVLTVLSGYHFPFLYHMLIHFNNVSVSNFRTVLSLNNNCIMKENNRIAREKELLNYYVIKPVNKQQYQRKGFIFLIVM